MSVVAVFKAVEGVIVIVPLVQFLGGNLQFSIGRVLPNVAHFALHLTTVRCNDRHVCRHSRVV